MREKYQELKKERLCCIQGKLKEELNVDLDIEELMKPENGENEEENDTSNLFDTTVFDVDNTDDVQQTDEMPAAPEETANPTSLEAIAADIMSADNNAEESSAAGEDDKEKKDEEGHEKKDENADDVDITGSI